MGSFFDAPHLSTGKTLPSRLFLLVVVHVVLASYYLANRLMCCKSSDLMHCRMVFPHLLQPLYSSELTMRPFWEELMSDSKSQFQS